MQAVAPEGNHRVAVSVLDLEQYRFRQSVTRMQHATDPMLPYSGTPNDTDVSLSIRCQFVLHRTIKRAIRALDDHVKLMVEPRRIELLTS